VLQLVPGCRGTGRQRPACAAGRACGHGGKDKANGLAGQQPSILDPGQASNAINASNGANAVDPAAAAGAANADYQSSSGVNLLI
jgi:hypothetical protein